MSQLTGSRSVLAVEVAGLVASEEAGGLGLRSSTTGEASVEVHDAVHTGSILSSANRLFSNVSYGTIAANAVYNECHRLPEGMVGKRFFCASRVRRGIIGDRPKGSTHIGRSDLVPVSLCQKKNNPVFHGVTQVCPYLRRDQGRETAAGDVAHLEELGKC